MTRTIRAAAATAALALLLSACSGGDDATGDGTAAGAEFDLVQGGTLTVCTDAPYPPFEYEEAGAPSG